MEAFPTVVLFQYLLLALPGIAYGFYKRSLIRGIGASAVVVFILVHIIFYVEPEKITLLSWATLFVVPLAVFAKVFYDRREFFYAAGWFGIALFVIWVIRQFL